MGDRPNLVRGDLQAHEMPDERGGHVDTGGHA